MDKSDLTGLAPSEIELALLPLGLKRYVPHQIFRWAYARRVTDFAAMTDLAKDLRLRLAREYEFRLPAVAAEVKSEDATTRYVYRLADGERTESVFIPGEPGQATLCLSSQVGCPLACTFCVSGLRGIQRNLTSGEIVGQALAMLAAAPPLDRVNVVFMGMGEALLNLEQLARSFAVLADPAGLAIAHRRMTVSTAGHVPAMAEFGRSAARPRLAVSLNATTDEVRTRLMPINRAWPIAVLLDACRRFPLARGERMTFEYVLLEGVNDSTADARRIPGLLAGIPSKVNLIPWNPTPGFSFATPADEVVDRFAAILHDRGVTVTVRRQRGADVGAACGQLALSRPEEAAAPSASA